MRCREARLRLNASPKEGRSLADDQELLAHLKACPACSRQAQAARDLQQAFSALSGEDAADAISWPEQIRRVEAQTALRSHQRKENPMSVMRDIFRRRPRLSYGLTVAVALLLAATVIPLKLDRTVGFEVAVAGVNKDLAFDTERINDLLERLGVIGATVDVTGCEQTCNLKIASLTSSEDAEVVRTAFKELGEGAHVGAIYVSLNAVTDEVSSSALGHVTKTYVTASGNVGDEAELRDMVAEKLKGMDFSVFFICDTSDDAQRTVELITIDSVGNEVHTLPPGKSVTIKATGEDFTWVNDNKSDDSMNLVMVTLMDGESAFCGRRPFPGFDVVDGCLSDKGRAQLEADGFTVTESIDADGTSVIKLTKMVDGKEQIITTRLRGDNPCAGDPAAKETPEESLPEGYTLSQNYPNPFNPTTKFDFSLPGIEHVTVEIFNINGQKVRTLLDRTMGPGAHTVEWDATDDNGAQVATGVYLYRLSAGDVTQTKKMSFVK